VERKIGNSEFVEVAFVPGFGTTSEPKSYSFTDQNLRSDHYTYRLKQIDFDGTFTYSNEVAVDVVAPVSFSLDQNYPNPFNPSTKITFSLAVDSKVSLKVFDVLGQQVISLIDQDLSQGVHTYDFNAAGINSGVYFYKIEATGVNGSEYTDVKKMILLK
ncbi:MAG: T9SS type A sorting domain-containing protein, partial [Ignavibacteriaceae bacterium]|nr:T9SS type A sorting domain-containing protein [Ignavibacteriaceae bacterium]